MLNLYFQTHVRNLERRNMTIFDLNFDCLSVIVDFLETGHLITLSATHKQFSAVVESNLRQRLARKTVYFDSPYTLRSDADHASFNGSIGMYEWDNGIQFKNFPIIVHFIRNFGSLIQSLWLTHNAHYKSDAAQAESVWQAINSYSSENLTELFIENYSNAALSVRTPFKKVEKLSLKGQFSRLYGGNVYSAVMKLTLNTIEFFNTDWLDHPFPLLEDLTVLIDHPFGYQVKGLTVSQLDRLLHTNQNIETLSIQYGNPEVLEVVANRSPQLKHLKLLFFETNTPHPLNIAFPNLISLKTAAGSLEFIENIAFDSLEEFETNSDSVGLIEMIKQNAGMRSTLRKLRIDRRTPDSEILEISNAHFNLTELEFLAKENVQVENVVRLIESSPTLQILRISTTWLNSKQAKIEALKNHFNQQWTFVQTANFVELERK